MNYILFNIIINSILVGVILMTQFVNYPLFKSIKSISTFLFSSSNNLLIKNLGEFVPAPM